MAPKWPEYEFRGDNKLNHTMKCPKGSAACPLTCCPEADDGSLPGEMEWSCNNAFTVPSTAEGKFQCQNSCACKCVGTKCPESTVVVGRITYASEGLTTDKEKVVFSWAEPQPACGKKGSCPFGDYEVEVKDILGSWVSPPECAATHLAEMDGGRFGKV